MIGRQHAISETGHTVTMPHCESAERFAKQYVNWDSFPTRCRVAFSIVYRLRRGPVAFRRLCPGSKTGAEPVSYLASYFVLSRIQEGHHVACLGMYRQVVCFQARADSRTACLAGVGRRA